MSIIIGFIGILSDWAKQDVKEIGIDFAAELLQIFASLTPRIIRWVLDILKEQLDLYCRLRGGSSLRVQESGSPCQTQVKLKYKLIFWRSKYDGKQDNIIETLTTTTVVLHTKINNICKNTTKNDRRARIKRKRRESTRRSGGRYRFSFYAAPTQNSFSHSILSASLDYWNQCFSRQSLELKIRYIFFYLFSFFFFNHWRVTKLYCLIYSLYIIRMMWNWIITLACILVY